MLCIYSDFREYYLEHEWNEAHDRLVAQARDKLAGYVPQESIAEFHRIESEALAMKEDFQRRVDGAVDPARLLLE